jgi:glutamyl-Q tRNA(Asp) synthetase
MIERQPVITRFAPSPSGRLHLGHAYAAMVACDAARFSGGDFLVRIEDIDQGRCRPEFEDAIFEDLSWLGIKWAEPVMRQSTRMGEYANAIRQLEALGVIYPCFCTRADIRAEIERSPAAPHGPEGAIYPGTCRHIPHQERLARAASGEAHALRIDIDKALEIIDPILTWNERDEGMSRAYPQRFGDVVLARKDTPTSYHLSVVVDDAAQGITLVTRGRDLFDATGIHRLLQSLLKYPVPRYYHHKLITDDRGKRLATRDAALSLETLRQNGASPDYIRYLVGLAKG